MKFLASNKKILSVLLAVLMAATSCVPAFAAFADDDEDDNGVIGLYRIETFYENGTIVPDYDTDEETGEQIEHIEYMTEGDKVQFTYQIIDCVLPDNGYVKWTSDTPTVCDVTEEGKVRAFDSSKGAAVRLWLDNEVATIPLVGSVMKSALEKVLFNDYVDLDTLDSDGIVAIVETAFGSDSLLAEYADTYKGTLIDSLRTYLDKVHTVISCTMYDSTGEVLAVDSFKVVVNRSTKVYSDFIPNGTHITNKQDLPTTVAKGSELQLSACTTPTRLHMGVVYSVKSSSIFSDGKVVATVNDSGLVSFKNTGTVTILVSPDTEGFIQNLLKYVNYVYKLENTGLIDSDEIAGILIDYVGLDMNRTVLTGILDAAFMVADIAGDSADPVQLSATAVKIIANIILQFTTNDSITFTVVDGVPCTDFKISGGGVSVREGNQVQLSITDAQPEAADLSGLYWYSEDPSVASVDSKTGVITARDAGSGDDDSPLQKTVRIHACLSSEDGNNDIDKSAEITVTRRASLYVSDVEVTLDYDNITIGQDEYAHATVYPERVASSNICYKVWGIQTGTDEDGNPVYEWAVDPYYEEDENGDYIYDENNERILNDGSVSNGIGKIDYLGHYYALTGGECTIACRVFTGYDVSGTSRISDLLSDDFYTISEKIVPVVIPNGKPVESIALEAVGTTSGGTLTTNSVEIDGVTHQYATVKKTAIDGYWGNGITVKANVYPEDATDQTVTWYIDNTDDFELSDQDDSQNTVKVKMKAAVENAATVNIYCDSNDRCATSQIMTLSVTKNYATGNTIDGDNLEITNGTTIAATHTMTFNGSSTGDYSACYGANWYTEDKEVASIVSVDGSGNAVIRGNDVGVTTVYCVSCDGAILDSATVTVYPDKGTLAEILSLCEKTVIKKTDENKADYKTYMRKLSYCYYLMNEEPMASQTTVDTYAEDLLYTFYKLGAFVDLLGIDILNASGRAAGDYISVEVKTSNYMSTSYELGFQLLPKTGMYKSIVWSSSDSSVNVERSGRCTPAENKACTAVITVTATDYVGNVVTDSVRIAFAKTQATGVEISPSEIWQGKAGDTVQLTATALPKGTLGIGGADVTGVSWSTSNPDIATVDENGLVTLVYGGNCRITATTFDGGKKAYINVNVVTNYDKLRELILTCEGVSLDAANYYPDSYQYYTDTLAEAKLMLTNANSTQDEVDEMYDKLDAAYKGLKKYNFIQKVTLCLENEEVSDYYQYDLSVLKEGVSYKNAQLPLKILLTPNNGSYASVEWESSNELIDVTQAGVASPNQNKSCYGEIKCTLTDHFGNKYSDTVWVSFAFVPVTSIELSESSIAGSMGTTHQLTYSIQPDGTSLFHIASASITDVHWESDDESIATVDENGLVTFVGTGETKVRVITYDGGFTSECSVSTQGDRRALAAAIEQYSGIDYMDYEYSYGIAFQQAYDNAVAALSNPDLTQTEIDGTTAYLIQTGEALEGHEFNYLEAIPVTYVNQKQNAAFTYKTQSSGSVANSATSYTYQGTSTTYNSQTILTCSIPSAYSTNYRNLHWSVESASANSVTELSSDSKSITIRASAANRSAKVVLKATVEDAYGRTVERYLNVVVAPTVVTGLSLNQTAITKAANGGSFNISATVTPSDAKVKEVIWTSSDESIATVSNNDDDGSSVSVTPHNSGTVTITATTFDGGYTVSCTVTLTTDFTRLASLYTTYNDFYNENKDLNIYTAASMENLRIMLQEAQSMLNGATANQADVDTMADNLRSAYNGLVEIVGLSTMTISVPEQENVSVVTEGYVRYSATSVNGAEIGLQAVVPNNVSGSITYTWTATGENISVSSTGVVSHSGATGSYGTVSVTATDELGNVARASINVSFVRIPVTAISFDNYEGNLVYGAPNTSVAIVPTLTGSTLTSSGSTVYDPSVTACTYTSSDPEIATVDNNGVVTFVSFGSATITATARDGGMSATLTAYTSNDTVALQQLVNDYASVDYMDYEYTYGIAFHNAYQVAQSVLANYTASQDTIDEALTALQTAYNSLDGHPFIGADGAQLLVNGEAYVESKDYVKDANNQMIISGSYPAGAMLSSAILTYDADNLSGVTAEYDNGSIVVTKTTDESSGSITVSYVLTDTYDRETVITKTIRIVDGVTMISSLKFTYTDNDNNAVETDQAISYSVTTFTRGSLQLGIKTYPEGAENYVSAAWSSSNSVVTVDQTGLVKVDTSNSGYSLTTRTYTANITCTLTLSDGSTVSLTVPVTLTR